MAGLFGVPAKEPYKRVSGYGAIGNTRTVALVGYDGSIDWCCLPRFDSPSIFASTLDSKKGGKWVMQPSNPCVSARSYPDDTNILRTDFQTEVSHVCLADFMPCSHTSEAWSTPPEVHGLITCVSCEEDIRFVFKSVFDCGMEVSNFVGTEHVISMKDEKDEIVLSPSVAFTPSRDGVDAALRIEQGEKRAFVLSYGEAVPRKAEGYFVERQRAKTEVFWLDWASRIRYRGRWRSQVVRSALALKFLVYSPTGAIVAAPTPSLPEALGWDRNWDYRYSWIRDSAYSLWAFHILGCRSATGAYLRWLIDNNPSLDSHMGLTHATIALDKALGGNQARQ